MSQTTIDLAQTVISGLALLGAIYAIVQQRRETTLSQELNAAAVLFDYYNAKISSLRRSLMRDSADREKARLESVEDREARLVELLERHAKVRARLEYLYDKVIK